MSLVKQLWIAIVGLMILMFFTSFFISTYSAANTFSEQLSQKNSDNANSLALMLSQMDKDEVMVELLVSAQFDTGNYKKIELLDPEGNERLIKEHSEDISPDVPEWFIKMMPLKAGKGIAQVQDGWQQYGQLIVESDDRFAYESLWKTTVQFVVWFLGVAMVIGLIGTGILRVLIKPLADVVMQAEAIGGRRFITSKEPKTLEFNRLVRAMNALSDRVRTMLENESRRLEEMRYKNQHDEVTSFANRDFFVSKLESVLDDEDQSLQHAIFLFRLKDLAEVNNTLGHQKTDLLLKSLAEKVIQAVQQHKSEFAESVYGRLNGSDFSIIVSGVNDWQSLAKTLEVFVSNYAESYRGHYDLVIPMAACHFTSAESRQNIFQKVDRLLAKAENEYKTIMMVGCQEDAGKLQTAEQWRETLQKALGSKGVTAQLYSVIDIKNRPSHQEAMMRLKAGNELVPAGEFLPWARRLKLLPELDLALVHYITDQLVAGEIKAPIAINLSLETLKNIDVRDQLICAIKSRNMGEQIWIELPERSVMDDIGVFVDFCELVKPLGCKVGLDKGGEGLTNISRLQEVGLDYIKIDAVLIHNISKRNVETENFIRGVCTLGHSIGLMLIAEGLQDIEELSALDKLGLDGATGPGVSRRN